MVKNSSASVLAILWALIPFFYMVPGQATTAQLFILGFASIFLLSNRDWDVPAEIALFLAVILLFILLSAWSELDSEPDILEYIKYFVFVTQFCILSLIVRRSDTEIFFRIFFKATVLVAIAHLLFIFSGVIQPHYGRYPFIGDSHPNLGGEIFAIAAVLGAISINNKKWYAIGCFAFLASAFWMQTRSGMLVIFIVLVMKIFFERAGRFDALSFSKGALLLAIGAAALSTISSVRLFFAEKIILLNDPMRGLEVGLVTGRDMQWLDAFNAFLDAPLLGQGMSYYNNPDVLGAHNSFLYSISMFGMAGLVFWILFLFLYYKMFKNSPSAFYYSLPIWSLLLLNDRFINLNAYPILFFFAVVQVSTFTPGHKSEFRRSNTETAAGGRSPEAV